jgi:RimJ/RimL family protein N-acetyltransferase
MSQAEGPDNERPAADAAASGADGPGDMPLTHWRSPPRPSHEALPGRHCRVEPVVAERHARDLHAANSLDSAGRMWTYLAYGPFTDEATYAAWVSERERSADPQFFAIVDGASGRAVGVASYLRIDPPNGVIEVGHLAYSPRLQRTIAATEAMYLMMQHVFELGYRRYEWKCSARNQGSRRAALRLGFTFEGVFRQHMIYKGLNRDTAWYSILDSEWPAVRAGFERWLDSSNFDADGRQRRSLESCRADVGERDR